VAVWWQPSGSPPLPLAQPSVGGGLLKRTRSHALLLGVAESSGAKRQETSPPDGGYGVHPAADPLTAAYGAREAARLSPQRGAAPPAEAVRPGPRLLLRAPHSATQPH
jgi:hypothetical protein